MLLFGFSLLFSLHGFPSHRPTPRLASYIPSDPKRRLPHVQFGKEVPLPHVL